MKKRRSFKSYSSMWESKAQSLKLAHHCPDAYVKKAMDDICFQAELADNSWEYAYAVCQGMKRLLEMKISPAIITKHSNLLQKLLYLGRDLMQTNSTQNDLFYLGVLVEIKIYAKWKQIEFYNFIISSLKAIKNKTGFLTDKLKDKLVEKLKKFNYALYKEFVESYLNSA